jgi:hypothetical protein
MLQMNAACNTGGREVDKNGLCGDDEKKGRL